MVSSPANRSGEVFKWRNYKNYVVNMLDVGQSMTIAKVTEDKKLIDIGHERVCECRPTNINCLTPKEWIKSQLGVWQFYYEARDVRNKELHPATFPISLAKKVISLFSHKGELVLDPFVGSGTVLVAAKDLERNAIGFDLNKKYIDLCRERIKQQKLSHDTKQLAIMEDARNINQYIKPGTISCLFTSPPYANLLNRARKNKSRRGSERVNNQYLKNEQYSQDTRDLGTLDVYEFSESMYEIFKGILPLMKPKGHCVINIADMWWENKRIPLHLHLTHAIERAGFELRNTIIWDRTNIVNRIGIFGWPSNYITMGTTFEYLLDFWRPA